MSTIITLDIYSGVPNPTWELTNTQSAELRRLLETEKEPTSFRSPAGIAKLGYRGFEISTINEMSLPKRALVFDGVLDIGDSLTTNYVDADSAVERFLLQTSGNALTKEQQSHAETEIQKNSEGGIANNLKDLQLFAVPPFNPGKWNNDVNIRSRNNCYNYANDKITNTFAQPGRGSGQMGPFPPSCSDTGAAAQRDGQKPVASASSTPLEGQFIALVIWPENDYHWYRLDSNAMWSHKPGQTPARNTDNSGQLISDPQSCDRGPYSIFCGFYLSIPSQTRIL